MSDIFFKCAACGKPLVADDTGAGLEINCPDCNASIIVPEVPPNEMVNQTKTMDDGMKIKVENWKIIRLVLVMLSLVSLAAIVAVYIHRRHQDAMLTQNFHDFPALDERGLAHMMDDANWRVASDGTNYKIQFLNKSYSGDSDFWLDISERKWDSYKDAKHEMDVIRAYIVRASSNVFHTVTK